ncbi:unnamed protein product [Calicophoron daubneyi]|uniref:Uncharacterized protein n=1 Tax=Calicophoron daubneyi TaxID=300641 RepID=A0AAV2TQ62_CALDB
MTQIRNEITVCLTCFLLGCIEIAILPTSDGARNSEKPVILSPPSDSFSSDGVLEFSCQADGYPKPVVNWHDANTGQKVIDRVPNSGSTSGIHVNQHLGQLMVSNPLKNKLYTFYCNASNEVGWTVSQPPVKGGLAYLESKFRHVPMDKSVHQGDRVLLECWPPMGIPEPKITWLHDGRPLNTPAAGPYGSGNETTVTNDPLIRLTGTMHLQFDSITVKHSGSYVCVAKNIAGEVRSPPAYVTVRPREKFLETPTDIRVRKGMNAKFKCRVEGNQMVQWSRGHGEGPIDPTRAELAEEYLLLKDVQLSDAGVYVCTAPGSLAADAVLTVESPPAFSRTPDDTTVAVGGVAFFHCTTVGYPKPSIYWELPDKSPIFPPDNVGTTHSAERFYLHKEGSLEIRDVRLSDAGKYQCTAHSSIDRIHSTATLTVVPATGTGFKDGGQSSLQTSGGDQRSLIPEFYPLAPIISLPPVNQTRHVGDLVILDCELGATREPVIPSPPASSDSHVDRARRQNSRVLSKTDWSVSWQRTTEATGSRQEQLDFGGFADEQRYSLLPGGSLQIYDAQLSDSGSYTCSAKTYIATPQSAFKETVLVRSNWTAHLQIVPEEVMLDSDMRQENPLSPPRNLRMTNVTESTITLAWEGSDWLDSSSVKQYSGIVKSHGGDHTSLYVTYWVEYYRPDRPVEGWKTVENSWPASTVQIGGLDPNTAYYFLIRPRWMFGRVGWASAPLGPIFTLQKSARKSKVSVPNEDVAHSLSSREFLQAVANMEIRDLRIYVLSPTRLRVSWTVVENPELIALINGFVIVYHKVNMMRCISSSMDRFQHSFGSGGEIDAQNGFCSLHPGTDREKEGIHDLYFRVQEMENSRKKLELQKSQNEHNFSSFSTSSIQTRSSYSIGLDTLTESVPTPVENSGLLRDLEPFTCYEVKVKPYAISRHYGQIDGRESGGNIALTFESFPESPPVQIIARWVAPDEIELSWAAPPVNTWNGLLTGYTIYVYDELGRNHQTYNVSWQQYKTFIKGLTGPHAHIVQLAAANCKGVGLRSKPLRLEPALRKIGLGVGLPYDERTGLPLGSVLPNSEQESESKKLTQQPWFIVTLVISLLMWCALIGLAVFCYRRQRYVLRKTAGGVLISNTSHCGSNNGDSTAGYINTNGSTPKKRHINEKGQMQMEPLIKPNVPRSETGMQGSYTTNGVGPPCNQPASSCSEQPAYGVYCPTNAEFDQSQWSPPMYVDSNGNSFQQPFYPLNSMPPQEEVAGVYATTSPFVGSLQNRLSLQPKMEQLHNGIQVGQFAYQPSNNLANFISTVHPHSPPYLTYQPGLVTLSQSVSDFSKAAAYRDCSTIPCVTGASGLPLMSPVAPLGNTDNRGRVSPPSVVDSLGSSVSVAPYATASIIQNAIITENSSGLPSESIPDKLVPSKLQTSMRDSTNQSDQGSFASGGTSSSHANNSRSSGTCVNALETERQSTLVTSQLEAGRRNTHRSSSNSNHSTYNEDKEYGARCSTPARAISGVGSREARGSTPNPLNNTNNYEERPMTWRNPSVDPSVANSALFNSRHSSSQKFRGATRSPGNEHIQLCAENCIPPPPDSPPPPAPLLPTDRSRQKSVIDPYEQTDEDNYQLSEMSSSVEYGFRSQDRNTGIESDGLKPSCVRGHQVYDKNAESSDEEEYNAELCEQNQHDSGGPTSCQRGRSTGNPSASLTCSKHDGLQSPPFSLTLAADEPQNSTYAQVY